MKTLFLLPFLFLFLNTLSAQTAASPTSNDANFDKLLQGLLKFSITPISCEELKENKEDYLVFDARAYAEYQVSHIDGAIHVGYDKFNKDAIEEVKKGTKIVVYCSVGFRSEKVGERLERLGFTNVYNLYGSIFEWSNLGYPLVNKDGATDQIHAIDEKWGKWIKNAEKVYWNK